MIKLLDENTISQIAAGEVIERPLNIVKELLENSIDAKSTRIIIEIEDGGLENIIITDNGIGIEKDDLKLAFVRHATSKIDNINDVLNVKSYGFRGEALSSIGIVANVKIITKQKNDRLGYEIEDNFGVITKISECAAQDGTKIIVKNLFDNLPVRKKFLKSGSVEGSRIADIVEKIALSKKDISFKFIQDRVEKFSTSGDNNLKNIVYTLYGKNVYENVIDIDYNYGGIKITGVIGNTSLTRNNRNEEIFFVNGRYIKSNILYKSIEEAYKPYLMQHKFPFSVLNIDMGDGLVDVNIHPQKLDVRFSDDNKVYQAVYEAVRHFLSNISLVHHEHLVYDDIGSNNKNLNSNIDIINKNTSNSIFDNNFDNNVKHDKEIDINNIKSIKELNNEKQLFASDNINDNNDEVEEKKDLIEHINEVNSDFIIDNKKNKNDLIDNYIYIGQLFKTYILIEYKDKFYIIDQHAAHEKIYYEKFMKELDEQNVISQKIMPIVITLTSLQHQVVEENILEFKKAGFDIDYFGERDIIVNSVPYNILDIGKKELLLEMIDDFSKNKSANMYDSINDKIASIACKKAVKGNNNLMDIEAKQLIKDLFTLDNPYNCPHGRPTIIEFNKYEIEKKFGRIV